jgi:hypothetical protein
MSVYDTVVMGSPIWNVSGWPSGDAGVEADPSSLARISSNPRVALSDHDRAGEYPRVRGA